MLPAIQVFYPRAMTSTPAPQAFNNIILHDSNLMSLFYEHPYLYFDKAIDTSSYELVLFFVIFWIIAHFPKTLSKLIFKGF